MDPRMLLLCQWLLLMLKVVHFICAVVYIWFIYNVGNIYCYLLLQNYWLPSMLSTHMDIMFHLFHQFDSLKFVYNFFI